jgi:hypothetical protein
MEGKVDTQNINTSSNAKVQDNQPQQPLQKGTVGASQEVAAPQERSKAGLFITPVLQFDSQALSVIFQVRDGLSGEVKQEYPQESVVKGRSETTAQTSKDTAPTDLNIKSVQADTPVARPEQVVQQNSSVDLNTAVPESNGSVATASTTTGVSVGLGGVS